MPAGVDGNEVEIEVQKEFSRDLRMAATAVCRANPRYKTFEKSVLGFYDDMEHVLEHGSSEEQKAAKESIDIVENFKTTCQAIREDKTLSPAEKQYKYVQATEALKQMGTPFSGMAKSASRYFQSSAFASELNGEVSQEKEEQLKALREKVEHNSLEKRLADVQLKQAKHQKSEAWNKVGKSFFSKEAMVYSFGILAVYNILVGTPKACARVYDYRTGAKAVYKQRAKDLKAKLKEQGALEKEQLKLDKAIAREGAGVDRWTGFVNAVGGSLISFANGVDRFKQVLTLGLKGNRTPASIKGIMDKLKQKHRKDFEKEALPEDKTLLKDFEQKFDGLEESEKEAFLINLELNGMNEAISELLGKQVSVEEKGGLLETCIQDTVDMALAEEGVKERVQDVAAIKRNEMKAANIEEGTFISPEEQEMTLGEQVKNAERKVVPDLKMAEGGELLQDGDGTVQVLGDIEGIEGVGGHHLLQDEEVETFRNGINKKSEKINLTAEDDGQIASKDAMQAQLKAAFDQFPDELKEKLGAAGVGPAEDASKIQQDGHGGGKEQGAMQIQ